MANEYVVTSVGGLVVGRATLVQVRVYSFAVLVLRSVSDGAAGGGGATSARMQVIS